VIFLPNIAGKYRGNLDFEMSSFFDLINTYRTTAKTEREKGTYFELLCIKYFSNEPFYADLFTEVQTYTEWAKVQGLSGKDTGIDLVATTKDGEFQAIQCKLYDADRKLKLIVSCQRHQKLTLSAVSSSALHTTGRTMHWQRLKTKTRPLLRLTLIL